MTTIHITIEDSREALSALAAILNLDIGFDIRIDLDEMDDDATAEDIDQLAHAYAIGNGVEADLAQIKYEHRQAAYDARRLEAEFAQGVTCSTCHAKKDAPCTTPGGKPYRSFAHIERIALANRKAGVK